MIALTCFEWVHGIWNRSFLSKAPPLRSSTSVPATFKGDEGAQTSLLDGTLVARNCTWHECLPKLYLYTSSYHTMCRHYILQSVSRGIRATLPGSKNPKSKAEKGLEPKTLCGSPFKGFFAKDATLFWTYGPSKMCQAMPKTQSWQALKI